MRQSLEGLARNAAKQIGRCIAQAALEELEVNVRSVIAGEEPMSEFARFYCVVPDEEMREELLMACGFFKVQEGYYNLEEIMPKCEGAELRCLTYSGGNWKLSDHRGESAWLGVRPKNFAELWILCEALGFKLNSPELMPTAADYENKTLRDPKPIGELRRRPSC